MTDWISPEKSLPEPGEPVSIRVKGLVRPGCFRIHDRWYAFVDLERWQMNTSPYWPIDRSWYLSTEQVEGWKLEETLLDR